MFLFTHRAYYTTAFFSIPHGTFISRQVRAAERAEKAAMMKKAVFNSLQSFIKPMMTGPSVMPIPDTD
jgi:hypothetical protein